MKHSSLVPISIVVTTLLLASSALAETVIITSESLHDAFEKYAVWKRDQGVVTSVVTVEEIVLEFAGRDVPDQIRNYLIDRYATSDLESVILGGDVDHVPARYLRDYSWNRPDGVDILSDLYYAGLDGDWDANGNGIYGEPPVSSLGIETDLADLIPELRVGRLPLAMPGDVDNYAWKQRVFAEASASRTGRGRMLLFGDVLFESNWQIGDCDECTGCEEGPCASNDGAEAAIAWASKYESDFPNGQIDELYERDYWWKERGRPDALPLDRQAFLQSVARGSDILFHGGRGDDSPHQWSLGPGVAYTEDIRYPLTWAPGDGLHGLIVSSASYTNQFDDTCIGAAWLLARGAGSLLVLSYSNLDFPWIDRRFMEQFRTRWFPEAGDTPVGEAYRNVQIETGILLGDRESTIRFNHYSLNLLGDPDTIIALDSEADPAADPASVPERLSAQGTLVLEPNPSRHGPRLRLRLSVPGHVDVSVLDVSGRRVESVFAGELPVGLHEWQVDSRTLEALPSGAYYVQVQTGGRLLARQKWIRVR